MGAVTAFFQAIAAACGWGKQRDAEVNSDSQQSNKEAEQLQIDREKAVADINSADQTKLNNDVAP